MTAIATRTRERLLDVARQLFASNGVEHTTMNDIATASDKGRRTIYTYFRNKKEIYDAVIERDAESIVSRLREVANSDLEPFDKLYRYIMARFDIIDETIKATSAKNQIISYLTLDYKRLERIRSLAVEKEKDIFKGILTEGVDAGIFDREQASRLPTVHQMLFQGVDVCHLHNGFSTLGVDPATMRGEVADFIIKTLERKV
ncbi:MAG: TetR/AcrR family transcriptional regulator [Muribaculaceae bacterium]|nr:TetR/AcrR family transcriptional regulator [Muribaculaceae bacterium]